MSEEEGGPTYTLEAYENELRNTVYAAYDDYDEAAVHERLEGLLFELRESYEPQIDTPADFERELDALVRDAYIPTGDVVDVLEAKVEELEEIGSEESYVDQTIEEAPDPDGPPEEEGPVDRLLDDS